MIDGDGLALDARRGVAVRPSTDAGTLAGPSASAGRGVAGRTLLAVGLDMTPLAHAAISARRETPSLARMCSTWEFAVLGEIPSSSASSALVRPATIFRATSNSRVVSGCQGSDSSPRPRATRDS